VALTTIIHFQWQRIPGPLHHRSFTSRSRCLGRYWRRYLEACCERPPFPYQSRHRHRSHWHSYFTPFIYSFYFIYFIYFTFFIFYPLSECPSETEEPGTRRGILSMTLHHASLASQIAPGSSQVCKDCCQPCPASQTTTILQYHKADLYGKTMPRMFCRLACRFCKIRRARCCRDGQVLEGYHPVGRKFAALLRRAGPCRLCTPHRQEWSCLNWLVCCRWT